jgi:hypothetical protein
VPNIKELKDKVLREAHESTYSIYLGGSKMYNDLKAIYWWYGMKRDVVECVSLATPALESRSSINDLLDCCNPCEFPSGGGSGRRLLWISLWDYLGFSLGMIPFG